MREKGIHLPDVYKCNFAKTGNQQGEHEVDLEGKGPQYRQVDKWYLYYTGGCLLLRIADPRQKYNDFMPESFQVCAQLEYPGETAGFLPESFVMPVSDHEHNGFFRMISQDAVFFAAL
jgi:hypothetical protein